MTLHPLIHSELVRQRQAELARIQPSLRPRLRGRSDEPDDLALLVQAAARGDGRAWESLIERFTPTLRQIARGYRLGAADVDDVVQATWTSAFSHVASVREHEAFAGWLCVIARREALRTIRQTLRELLVEEPSVVDDDGASTPENAVLEAERHRVLHDALGRLTGRQRALLHTLVRDGGASYHEVSRRLGVPVGSIGPTRERALARLRRDHNLAGLVEQV